MTHEEMEHVRALTRRAKEAEEVSKQLANAIKKFRNLLMLKSLTKLRSTAEYSALCEAWRNTEYQTQKWLDQQEKIEEATNRADEAEKCVKELEAESLELSRTINTLAGGACQGLLLHSKMTKERQKS